MHGCNVHGCRLHPCKWRERSPFNRRDLASLASDRSRVPGADDARLVGVSRTGFDIADVDVALTPADLIEVWGPA